MLEVLEKYGRGFIFYVGWFLGDNRKHPEIKPMDLLEDERLLICSLMCLVGSLAFYFLLFLGHDFKSDVITASLGQRLVAWAGAVFIANVVALAFGLQSRVLDVTSAILRVVPIISLMNTIFGFAVFKVVRLVPNGENYAPLVMLVSMSVFALAGNLLGMPRSMALVEDSRPLSVWTIVGATSLFIFAVDMASVRSSPILGGAGQ
jgi:hypothetical protein